MGLFTPNPSINYLVITYMYAACCFLSLLFYGLERALTNAEEDGGNLVSEREREGGGTQVRGLRPREGGAS